MNSLSIFIVENEIITARSIAKNIKNFGYQLAGIATSGSEAILKILQTRPNLVLIDIFLDKNSIDGITVADKIQSYFEVPIIYLTAHSDRETLERAKITSPFGYILKPYSSKNLQIGIELALHKHQQDLQVIKREKILTTYFDTAEDAVIATDRADRVIYLNPVAASLSKSNAIQENDSTVEIVQFIDERTQKISQPVQEVLEQGEVVYLEDSAILLKKTKRATKANQSESSKLDRNQSTAGSVLILTQSKTEINRHKSRDCLFKDLSIHLVDSIQHELRTPLTVILSTAQSLESYRQKWTVEKQDQNLARIQQAVGQIKELLDNVAIWTEVEKGTAILKPDWVNLMNLGQDIVEELKLVDREQHQLTLSIQGKSKMVLLDRNTVRCIMVNLLLNGLKYSPRATKVVLSLEFSSNLIIIRVSDRGIGIPIEEQKQIFEPFYRASNTTTIRGSGLGLSIVKAYVQLCGGSISLSSKPQSGTIFTVCLPLKK